MAGQVRQQMIEGAVQLLASRGLQATSFSEVLALTGAPRGSLYHHFPEGKDQLVSSAVHLAGRFLVQFMDRAAGKSALQVTDHFLALWRSVLERSNCSAGCAVLAVTVAADSERLIEQAVEVFHSWRECVASLLVQSGMQTAQAQPVALMLIAAAEGAVVLSRAERSLEPFDAVAAQLREHVRQLVG